MLCPDFIQWVLHCVYAFRRWCVPHVYGLLEPHCNDSRPNMVSRHTRSVNCPDRGSDGYTHTTTSLRADCTADTTADPGSIIRPDTVSDGVTSRTPNFAPEFSANIHTITSPDHVPTDKCTHIYCVSDRNAVVGAILATDSDALWSPNRRTDRADIWPHGCAVSTAISRDPIYPTHCTSNRSHNVDDTHDSERRSHCFSIRATVCALCQRFPGHLGV